jgi:hypothetical protein
MCVGLPGRRSFGPGLLFLVLFASRQKEQKATKGEMYIVPRWRGKYFKQKDFSIGGWTRKKQILIHPHLDISLIQSSDPRQRGIMISPHFGYLEELIKNFPATCSDDN